MYALYLLYICIKYYTFKIFKYNALYLNMIHHIYLCIIFLYTFSLYWMGVLYQLCVLSLLDFCKNVNKTINKN